MYFIVSIMHVTKNLISKDRVQFDHNLLKVYFMLLVLNFTRFSSKQFFRVNINFEELKKPLIDQKH